MWRGGGGGVQHACSSRGVRQVVVRRVAGGEGRREGMEPQTAEPQVNQKWETDNTEVSRHRFITILHCPQ